MTSLNPETAIVIGASGAVEVNRDLLRPTDPLEIRVDSSRACRELGWSPRTGLEVFLHDMLNGEAEHKNVD